MAGIIQAKSHVFYSSNKLIFGSDSARSIAGEVQQLRGTKVLLVTDPGVAQADLLKPVKESLESGGIPYAVFDKVEPEPPSRLVGEGVKQCKSEGCDLVVGIGGGSSLDVAKGIAIMAINEGDVIDYGGMDMVPKRGLPKILLPTTAGTGSEVTRVIVVTDEKENVKKAIYSLYCLADVAIVDPLLTITMPPIVTADSGLDALVHAIETYVSADATPFSDILAERAIELIAQYLPMAWAKSSNIEARHFMSLGATLAGIAFSSGGLGAVHALSNCLGVYYHMPHGRSNAVMLPHVMRYNLSGNYEKFTDIAALMDKDVEGLSAMEAAQLSVEAVEELMEIVQVSYHLRDYGVPESDLSKLVEGGMKVSRLFGVNPRDLTEEDVRSIYEASF
jgi:alcohol dehydrogenase class IV